METLKKIFKRKRRIDLIIYVPIGLMERGKMGRLLERLEEELKESPHTKIKIICGR